MASSKPADFGVVGGVFQRQVGHQIDAGRAALHVLDGAQLALDAVDEEEAVGRRERTIAVEFDDDFERNQRTDVLFDPGVVGDDAAVGAEQAWSDAPTTGAIGFRRPCRPSTARSRRRSPRDAGRPSG